MNLPIRIVVLGAGDRGRTYAAYAKASPQEVQIVGVAEPNQVSREWFVKEYNLPADAVWLDWKDAVDARPDCDVMAICMPDALHHEPALACLDAGYHLLLEKPMARSWAECKDIEAKVEQTGKLVLVGHVLRYTVYFSKIKALLDAKVIGDVVSINHFEPVAYRHAAHSFCRGNWGNTERSTPMIVQKCCHDFDQFAWWLGEPCVAVSSFGSLMHFKAENQPAGAANRCLDCPAAIERACPYSARKIYLESTDYRYPFADKSDEAMMVRLQDGPYGRCVYACDNDAVDNQIVNLAFGSGVTVSHSMQAYTYCGGRQTKIFGTHGEIVGDGRKITISDFTTRTVTVWDAVLEAGSAMASGHGGGDFGLMRYFVKQLQTGTTEDFIAIFKLSLASHVIAFAAEKSRLNRGQLIDLQEVK